ncbi:hypothetical protein [Eubacterium ventriosum]|uniref:hypothetical protein n=1 Tax=Eubacterium ventriosum TaxID=39496 RepID=UPI00242B17FB|nr:hypothetical protein [Eubacterium ventriosum]
MRLIDVNITIKELNDKIARLDAKQQIYMENGLISIADSMAKKIELCIECRELLEHQPTAYDVDKVVEQLGKKQNNKGFGGTIQEIFYDSGLEDAVVIVKGGGIDGNTNT